MNCCVQTAVVCAALILLSYCRLSSTNSRSNNSSTLDNSILVLTHPTNSRSVTVVTEGDRRRIYDGVCVDCGSYEFIEFDVEGIDPLGDGVQICWLEPKGWYVRSLRAYWIATTFKDTNFTYRPSRSHNGAFEDTEYLLSNCGGVSVPERKAMPHGSLLVTEY